MSEADGWRPLGPVVRLGCPCCDLVVDEPPAETSAGLGGDALTYRIRHRSAVPALAAHVLADHPESAAAGHVRVAVAEHGSVEQAIRAELELLVRAALPDPLVGHVHGEDLDEPAEPAAVADPYDEDGYCRWCGNGRWKRHGPECGWADAHGQ
jgi:hypothetical protein